MSEISVTADASFAQSVVADNDRLFEATRIICNRMHECVDEKERHAYERQLQKVQSAFSDPACFSKLVVRGMMTEELNAIRRTLLADLRFLAVDVVSISANSSQMYDEMLASRIAHVPLRAPRDLIDHDHYVVHMMLEASYPADARGVMEVMSDSLMVSDTRVQPHRGFRIVRLQPGQSVRVSAVARPGTAREHTKWRAVHTAVLTQEDGCNVLVVETNWQQDALGAVCDAVDEVCLRIEHTIQDISNPQGGSDVDVMDHFDAVGVGYA